MDAALSRGDLQHAFTLLMTRYGDPVYRYALATTGDAQLAEEVRQQVFVEVYRDLPGFGGRAPVRGWLFAIVRHRCLDATKVQRRWGLRYKNELPGDPEIDRIAGMVSDQTELMEQLDRHRLAQVVDRCLQTLTPAAREAVLLRYQQELSYDEAAEVTGERPGTLQQRVARALPVLRKCVEAQLRTGSPGGLGGSR
ncbi:MAG TPA: sigma-70 family RNA polymerase sigma factor [Kofleriaceae bacterium]|nr:sigma-70 family RNA polymerase sigma factor [Kofleriaceae bacterium]